MLKELTEQQSLRYARHIMLPSVDFIGQEKLLASHVVIVGAGGLGCAVIPYLAASGIGQLTLVDHDVIERSNLQRQILYRETDLGALKAETAANFAQQINSDCQLRTLTERLDEQNIQSLLAHFPPIDLIVDCTDNLAVRLCLNRYCYHNHIPLVSGAAIRMEGQVTVFPMRPTNSVQEELPCYACFSQFFGEQELTCMESGVLSPLVGVIGTLQATEAVKLLMGVGTSLQGKVLLYDAAYANFQTLQLTKQNNCAVCG